MKNIFLSKVHFKITTNWYWLIKLCICILIGFRLRFKYIEVNSSVKESLASRPEVYCASLFTMWAVLWGLGFSYLCICHLAAVFHRAYYAVALASSNQKLQVLQTLKPVRRVDSLGFLERDPLLIGISRSGRVLLEIQQLFRVVLNLIWSRTYELWIPFFPSFRHLLSIWPSVPPFSVFLFSDPVYCVHCHRAANAAHWFWSYEECWWFFSWQGNLPSHSTGCYDVLASISAASWRECLTMRGIPILVWTRFEQSRVFWQLLD